NLIPKILPQAFKSIEYIEGNGEPGSIKKVTFGEGSQFKYMKQKVEAVDKENFVYIYSMGDPYVRLLVSITPLVTLSSSKRESRLAKKRRREYSRPSKLTYWRIPMPT
ncbi:hypothetical protein Gohar_008408, partial [Gossypium harknessii]|nr:hypothetical protein [Gossypium harknessii]